MRTINFTEKNITINGNQVPIDSVVLVKMIDDSVNEKTNAIVKIFLKHKTINLFSGLEYKPLNEFTEQEIDNKIIQLIN